ncbi:MAG: hypothetical protein GF311_20930 [Candidatus Lokiarchaeota archaeon]|nr:hypothetical protein [Candidatus Lokiarchaeota archaeon]
MNNIHALDDEKRKEERLTEINKLEEQITYLKEDILNAKKKLDDLSFEYEDRINEMKKQNNKKFQERFLGVTILEFYD